MDDIAVKFEGLLAARFPHLQGQSQIKSAGGENSLCCSQMRRPQTQTTLPIR